MRDGLQAVQADFAPESASIDAQDARRSRLVALAGGQSACD
jgi:hypothetical protein